MVIAFRWRRVRSWWDVSPTWPGRIYSTLRMGNHLDDADSSPTRSEQHADIATFETFVQQHERQILNYLWRMTADEQTAYDLCQETFLRAWQHFHKIRGYERPRAWLFRVATNLALSYLRKQPRTIADLDVVDEDEREIHSDPIFHFVESDLVRQILHALPPRRRAALILCEVYGLTTEEVAHALYITPNALRMTLSRGREQFRQLYVKEMQS